MSELYCIEHEQMVHAEDGPILGHEMTVRSSADDSPEIEFCEFELGWAICPPPEPSIDLQLDENYMKNESLVDMEEYWPIWTFEPLINEMVLEERVQ